MVEANDPDAMPRPMAPAIVATNPDETVDVEVASWALRWTAELVANVNKILRASVSADELKKLSVESAKPEFKKVIA